MFVKNIIVLCSLLVIIKGYLIEADNRVKRSGDIDLQTCIDNFNVHRDKIIRTQDSQNMGAKYLSEMDLGSREECLRLCCETDNCDVFVFEEKNSGSCYLFHCGPPEDFKCKFTHHVNYSSAVLSINRHLPDLESQIKLTKHEQDLTKLRKQDIEPEVDHNKFAAVDALKPTPPTSTTPVITKEIIPILGKPKEREEVHKCSRFQFPCRSTGDCIAIYNACDGIPQCADGSDEGPECPSEATTAPPPQPPPVATSHHQVDVVPPQALPAMEDPNNNIAIPHQNINSILPQNNSPPQHYLPHQSPQSQQLLPDMSQLSPVLPPQADSDFIRQMADPLRNHRMPYQEPPQPMYVPQLQQIPQQGQGVWIPHQETQLQGQGQIIQQYQDKNAHIFNHKENGLQVHDSQDVNQLQFTESLNAKMASNFYGENYRQPIQQENWPNDERYSAQPRYQQPNILKSQESGKSLASNELQQPISNAKISETVNSKNVQEKLAHDLKHSKDSMEHGNNIHHDTVTKQDTRPKHHQEYPDVVAYKLTDDSQDGISEVPRGAILSLTLGLIITCVMAILIGCRVRVVRRRLRKGGKSYAHDADYLVNGMYL